MFKKQTIQVGVFLVVAMLAPLLAAAEPANVNPNDYPKLTAKEIGQIRHMVRLSRQLPGDWTDMGTDLWSVAERTLQFQLAYMADILGLVQHNYTPAYRELYRTAMDALIQKMTIPDVWETWMTSSRGGTIRNGFSDVKEGWIDPIRKDNIMLKGYLLQAGAMYEMLYRDGKYEKPDAFTFRHFPGTYGNGPVIFRYSLSDVAKIVYNEYVEGNYKGVQCEPNVVFPQCNQSPILGLINYDQVHGTHYAADVMPKFKAAWLRNSYTDPKTKDNINFFQVSTGDQVGLTGPVGDGWAGSWMDVWDPDFMKTVYPVQRAHYLKSFLTGAYAEYLPAYGNKTMISLGFGMFAFMAAEMGDETARKDLLAYADRNFHPIWKDGEYYYPRSDDYAPDVKGNSHGVDTWTGNVLLAMARLDTGHGFQELYHEPWGKAELGAPYIGNVDDLTTSVSQAWYDAGKKALIVTLVPGPVTADKTSFVVHQLDRAKNYVVSEDGKIIGHLGEKSAGQGGPIAWRKDGMVLISSSFHGPHSFVIEAEN